MDQYLGEIRMFAGNYAPQEWALCNGQLLPISGNEPLYALLGIIYGGDGITTFGLPDLRGRVVVHKGKNTTPNSSNFSIGQKGGTEKVVLTPGELPRHNHFALATTDTATVDVPNNARWAVNASINRYSTSDPNVVMHNSALGNTGDNQAHDNMMPSLVINYIISLQGTFPSPY